VWLIWVLYAGKYHGILEFPDDFPMKPPSIKILTPSGRFEVLNLL
jgi:ubiquitin-conjugating enzyme E2 J2